MTGQISRSWNARTKWDHPWLCTNYCWMDQDQYRRWIYRWRSPKCTTSSWKTATEDLSQIIAIKECLFLWNWPQSIMVVIWARRKMIIGWFYLLYSLLDYGLSSQIRTSSKILTNLILTMLKLCYLEVLPPIFPVSSGKVSAMSSTLTLELIILFFIWYISSCMPFHKQPLLGYFSWWDSAGAYIFQEKIMQIS